MRSTSIKILIIAGLIAIIGILCIYSSTYQKADQLSQEFYKRQIIWIIIGLLVYSIVSNFNYRRFWDITYVLYAVVLFLLFLVFVLGIVRLGAQRWLKFIWFSVQPSELAKLAVVVFLARYFSMKSEDAIFLSTARLNIFRSLVLPFILIAIPMFFIIEQPDLGSGLMILFIFLAMVYLAGVKMKYIFIFLLISGLSVPIFWHFALRDYQRDRLMVFLNPNIDPLGAGYTLIQSKIAIGSGALWGKGWLAGTQSQLHFLPESHTDFIFATFAEQWGFLGSCILLLLYYLLIRQGIKIAQKAPDPFGRLLAFGISLALGIQIFINIAMTIGLMPIVGLPLPLMSYGGSSVIVTFFALGILANIAKVW